MSEAECYSGQIIASRKWDNGKENENYYYIYMGYIGVKGYRGYIGVIWG